MAGTRQEATQSHLSGPERWGACSGQPERSEERSQSLGGMLHAFASEPGAESLARMIEAEIIPRLMLAHRSGGSLSILSATNAARTAPEDVAELARIVVEHDTKVACAYVDALRGRGVRLETIFLDLISPAAQLLGEMWVADVTSFTEVTIGLSQLQHLLHHYGPAFESESEEPFCASRALLTTMPGDQHTFGISMVEEFFRRAGWDVTGGYHQTSASLIKAVRSQSFDLIGLSVGSDILLGELTSVIGSIRKASRNRAVRIVVGGRMFVEHPEYASQVGADGTASDARQAVLQLAIAPASRAVAVR